MWFIFVLHNLKVFETQYICVRKYNSTQPFIWHYFCFPVSYVIFRHVFGLVDTVDFLFICLSKIMNLWLPYRQLCESTLSLIEVLLGCIPTKND